MWLGGIFDSEMSSKDDCKKEIKAVNARNEAQPSFMPTQIGQDCILHRFVAAHHYEPTEQSVSLVGLEVARLSVYVEGSEFPSFDISEIFNDFRAQGVPFVAAFRFPARVLLDLNQYQFLHDPHPYTDEKTGEQKPQHPNHAQVICVKKADVALVIKSSILNWTIRP